MSIWAQLRPDPYAPILTAEDVLPGHPDRICDAIAERIVGHALAVDPEALVGVEVALHRRSVFVSGRVAASDASGAPVVLGDEQLDAIVDDALTAAGYTGRWALPVRVVSDLDVGGLDDDEREIRRLSDDQGIAVGYAEPQTVDDMPIEVPIVRRLRAALEVMRAEHPDELGPDGKALVTLWPMELGMRPAVRSINLAIQHAPGVGYPELLEWLHAPLADALDELAAVAEPPLAWRRGPGGSDGPMGRLPDPDVLRINGIGDFTCGGPMGDNGLSGKKLVVDHYGPRVPIGGGALCGKDVHKPDRVGPLRARQIALRLARATGAEATVTLGWLPGLESPDRLHAVLVERDDLVRGTRPTAPERRFLDAEAIADLISVPDLSLAGSARDLELATVDWPTAMRRGYLGNGQRWER